MKATILHNPRCGTSRKVLEVLQAVPGVTVEVVEYLKTPPTRAELAALYDRAGMTPRDGLRTKEPLVATRGLADADDATILDAMVAHPVLINRPLVATEKGVRLCRPQDLIHEIL